MKKTASPARRVLRVLGSIALVLSLLIFTWLMNGGAAYGWLLNADHYGAPFAAFASSRIVSRQTDRYPSGCSSTLLPVRS